MERTTEQKVLNVVAIIELIAGIINIALAIFMIAGGGLALDNAAKIAEETIATVDQANQVGNLFIGEGIASLIQGGVQIFVSSLMRKFVKDPAKYKTLRTLIYISIALSLVGLVTSIISKSTQTIVNNVVSLLIDGFVLYLINKIRNSTAA